MGILSLRRNILFLGLTWIPLVSDYPVSAFSGGWKMRIGLGKVLLKEPNILLLDE